MEGQWIVGRCQGAFLCWADWQLPFPLGSQEWKVVQNTRWFSPPLLPRNKESARSWLTRNPKSSRAVGHEDVTGLYIAMNDVLGVGRIESIRNFNS
jgi:hypothetical protein